MPKKRKSVKKILSKNKKLFTKNKKVPFREVNFPIKEEIKKEILPKIKEEVKEEKPKESKLKKVLKILWFSFGILDLIWTIFWLIYSLNQKNLYNLIRIVFFATGFYIFCFFILITLIYYIIKMARRISKGNGY
jgi:cellulose synthase/poly-beta-1,6-N-acetylglucosamine synthase-like glycosyltransferase